MTRKRATGLSQPGYRGTRVSSGGDRPLREAAKAKFPKYGDQVRIFGTLYDAIRGTSGRMRNRDIFDSSFQVAGLDCTEWRLSSEMGGGITVQRYIANGGIALHWWRHNSAASTLYRADGMY